MFAVLQSYSISPAKAKELSPEDYARFREIFPDTPEDQQAVSYVGNATVDLPELEWLTRKGFQPSVLKFRTLSAGFLPAAIGSEAEGARTVHVHIGGIGTLHMDEVAWLEDACTQEVQKMLNDGWRILACCYYTANRRPDYVFGRNSKREY